MGCTSSESINDDPYKFNNAESDDEEEKDEKFKDFEEIGST